MASFQASWVSSFTTISHSNAKKSHTFKPFRVTFSLTSSNDEASPNSPESASETEQASMDPVKLAFAKAREYKKLVQSSPKLKVEQNPIQGSDNGNNGGTKEVSESVRIAMEKAKEYKKSGQLTPKLDVEKNPVQDSDSIANGKSGETKELPDSVRVAMEKAKEYSKNKGNVESDKLSGLEKTISENSDRKTAEKKAEKKSELSISNIDFVGLNFADKKIGRALPAGLVPISDPFPEGDIPEVEIIVGDTSKFVDGKSPNPDQVQENESNVYKPKVSTWGVFPRPSNISKTFGGGRNIKPGEALETAEEKAAKDARTKELIAAYKKRTGKYIDPKLKSECDEALKDGDSLMNVGKLNEALPYYQTIMDKLPFQSELHGLAALQWSICLDSLRRTKEARAMYERLQSHPNVQVNKRAKQFMFSFQAMEMMKVTASSPASLKNTGYQNYFEAFVEKKSNYPVQETEEQVISLNQTLPYILLIISPIFLVLLAAVQKRI